MSDDKPTIESVKPADLPPDNKDETGVTPDAIDGSQQTENADDNARPAPDTDTTVDTTDDIYSTGYLTEDDANKAKGRRKGYVIPEGTAFKIVKDD